MIKPFWRDMTRADFQSEEIGKAVAVLPIAAIEQHGAHLPTGTDAMLAEGYIERVIALKDAGLPLIFLPVQQVGWSEEHLTHQGTLTSSWRHLLPVWMDIALSVKRCGINKLILINSHGGNVPIMDIMMQDLRVHHGMIVSATNWLRFGYPDGLFDADEIAYGIHGGAIETSMMMHLAPGLVDMEKAVAQKSRQQELVERNAHLHFYGRKAMGWIMDDLSTTGIAGNAMQGQPEKGAQLMDHIAREFLVYAREVMAHD